MKTVFTTGQIAKHCKVASRTVSAWFDSGELRGYRIPSYRGKKISKGDRRIPREQLIRFLKEHGMPLGSLEEEMFHKILVLGAEKLFVKQLHELLPTGERFKYEIAQSGFEAGLLAETFHPNTIIIDMAIGRSESIQIVANLRKYPAYEKSLIVALAGEDEAEPDKLTEAGFSEVFKKPFDVMILAERVQQYRKLLDDAEPDFGKTQPSKKKAPKRQAAMMA